MKSSNPSRGGDLGPAQPRSAESSVDTVNLERPWVLLRSADSRPLIYRKMIRDFDARSGELVNVYDRNGALFGRGLFNSHSQIGLRMLSHGPAPVDDNFWRTRLGAALDLRRRLGVAEQSDAYRLAHAEGDQLSGLVIERFADTLIFEVYSLGMLRLCPQIAQTLTGLLPPAAALDRPQAGPRAWRLVLRALRRTEELEGFKLSDALAKTLGFLGPSDAPTNVIVREHGVRYRVDTSAGQKTGFFCDQRDNRRRLAGLCRDASVLDLCCYNGAFGLCARLLGGAKEVTGVDLDESALAIAKENANLNQCRMQFVHADAFAYLRQMLANGRRYDVIVLDPPKLALSREELDAAQAKYHDLNKLAILLVAPGGTLLTCSCSGLVAPEHFLEIVRNAARVAGRQAQLLELTGAAPDHPVLLSAPESAYLKAAWLRVL